MPDYNFTGAYPRVLAGLSQGVNAAVLYSSAGLPPYGSTIEAYPGDAIRTDEPYVHPELAEVEPDAAHIAEGLQAVQDAAAPGADGIEVLRAAAAATAVPAEPVVPIQLVAAPETPAPAPVDPAHDAMTAEGAPAPAEPAAN